MDSMLWSAGRIPKLATALSLLFLSVGVTTARLDPVAGYEPSIYTGTPLLYWICLAGALLFGMAVVSTARQDRWRYIGLCIVGCAMFTLPLLPIFRGYWMVGAGDPLTILGYMRHAVTDGSPFDQLYPAMLAIPVINSEILGITQREALLFMPPIFFGVFVLSIPLVMRTIGFRTVGILSGGVVALLLLPINLTATHLLPHMNSMMVLFVPFVLFVVFLYITSSDPRFRWPLLILLTVSVFFHPQQAMVLTGALAAVACVQYLSKKHPELPQFGYSITRPVLYLGSVWFLWIISQEGFGGHIYWTVVGLLRSGTTSATGGRDESLSELGITLVEFALRLFAIDIVAIAIASFAIILNLRWLGSRYGYWEVTPVQDDPTLRQRMIETALIASLVPVLFIFGFFLVSGKSQQFMRIVGFGMVIGTLLTAIGLTHLHSLLYQYTANNALRHIALVLVVGILLFSALTYYSSPFIYRDSMHATEASVAGFEHAFEHHADRGDSAAMLDLRRSVWRYTDAIEGSGSDAMKYTGAVGSNPPPDHFANQSLTTHYESNRQLVVTDASRFLDGELYAGLRLSEDDFEYLETEPGINKHYDNADLSWYYITANQTGL